MENAVNTGLMNVSDAAGVVWSAVNGLVFELVGWIPKLLIALVIWYIGKYLIDLGVKFVSKIDIKKTKLDDKFLKPLKQFLSVFGRFLLVLVVLDYLGVGSTVIGAVAGGVTAAVAIALGLAFGKALEPDAKEIVKEVRKWIKK